MDRICIQAVQANDHGLPTTPGRKYLTPPCMTAEPGVTSQTVATNDSLILALNGLWTVISEEDVVACVSV